MRHFTHRSVSLDLLSSSRTFDKMALVLVLLADHCKVGVVTATCGNTRTEINTLAPELLLVEPFR